MLDSSSPARLNPMVMQLDNAVKRMQQRWQEQSSESDLDMHFKFSLPTAGFENNAVRRLIVTFGRAKDIRTVPIAMLLQIESSPIHATQSGSPGESP